MQRYTICAVIFATLLALPVQGASPQVRDAGGPAPAGTATIRGVVVSADTPPQPVRRAIVTIRGLDLPTGRSVITDDTGRFSIGNLPAGQFSVTVAKRGYVPGVYGAVRAGRPGTPARLATGQSLDATIILFKGAVLTGQIRDERGEPVAGLRVFAIDSSNPSSPPPTSGDAGVLTDDRGIYRLYGLAPRTYLIAATTTASVTGDILRRTAQETDLVLTRLKDQATRQAGLAPAAMAAPAPTSWTAFAPMFYPGTEMMTAATGLKVTAGEVRDGLDFSMRLVPVTTIEGTIVSADGPLPASLQMSIAPTSALQFFALGGASPQLVQPPRLDGSFKYGTIIPGHYVITARGNRTAPPANGRAAAAGSVAANGVANNGRYDQNQPETMYGVEEIDVTGRPVGGLTIQLQRGSRFSGQVKFDVASPPSAPDILKTTVAVQLLAQSSGMNLTVGNTTLGLGNTQVPPVALHADGTFEMVGVPPGRYKIAVIVPPAAGANWWFTRAMGAGRDLLDSVFEVTLGTDIINATLTLTDKHTELAGTLQSAAGLAAPDYFVIAMPADAALRIPGSRRIRTTRPATDGAFSFADLPVGDYLLVALTDVEPEDLQTPEFLADITAGGVKVTIADGEHRRQDLRIAVP